MQEIARVDEPARAHLISGYLASHGIPAQVCGDQPFWSDGSLVPKDMRPTVLVDDQFEERARQLLADFEANRAKGETWNCPQCGDSLPAAFDECPVCRKPRSPK
jgi:hypothetical protein